MNHERFVHMLEAYGASSAHWPDDERLAAEALLVAPGEAGITARAALRTAAALDAALDADPSIAPDADFLRQIVASAGLPQPQELVQRAAQAEPDAVVDAVVDTQHRQPPQPPTARPPRPRSSWTGWRVPRDWFAGGRLIGAGLLSAGAIGLATGLVTMSLLVPANMGGSAVNPHDEPIYGGTVFSSTASDWSEE